MRVALIASLLSGLLLFTDCQRRNGTPEASPGVSTFILVRHAEKDYGDDPDLIASGEARAEDLATMLARTGLAAIYSTDTKRTLQTAAPTAREQELSVRQYGTGELADFARTLRRRHRGETVLVVGHSNTTPALANYLTGEDANPRFSELDYGNLLVVTVAPDGSTGTLYLRY